MCCKNCCKCKCVEITENQPEAKQNIPPPPPPPPMRDIKSGRVIPEQPKPLIIPQIYP